jgi:hypothetical protein
VRPRTGSLIIIVAIACAAVAAYLLYNPARLIFARPERADVAVLERAMDSVYAVVAPSNLESSVVDMDGGPLRCDLLELPRDASLVRTNLAIKRAVEKAGGEVVYGLESSDDRRRWQTVTLGVSDGDSLIREVILTQRVRR